MQVEPNPDEVRVCLTVGNGAEVCQRPPSEESKVVFDNVTLQSGTTPIRWSGTDNAGNESPPRQATLSLTTDAPLVVIESPTAGGVGTQDHVDVVALVTDVDSGTPIAGAKVKLFRNALPLFSGTAAADGRFSFLAVGMHPGPNALQVSGKGDGLEGFSIPVTAVYKDTRPALSFVYPEDGSTINVATGACAEREGDCHLDVTLQVQNAEYRSAGQLEVSCAGSNAPVVYETALTDDVLTFSDVLLTDQRTCQLTATVTDRASLVSDPASIELHVDRVAPVLLELKQPASFIVGLADDLDPVEPDIQLILGVEARGLEVGQSVRFTITADDGTTQFLEHILQEHLPENSSQVVQSERATLNRGTSIVRITTSDSAGNAADPLARVIRVLGE